MTWVSTFPDLGNPAAVLPADTLGFVAAGFDPSVANWRRALSRYELREVLPYPGVIEQINDNLNAMAPDGDRALAEDATVADALDLGLDLVSQFTGIDLERGFFAHLAGELIVVGA